MPDRLERSVQSSRAIDGSVFEQVVSKILGTFLSSDGIVVTSAKEQVLTEVIQDSTNIRNLLDYTRIPVKCKCDQKQLQSYPDSDLFVLTRPRGVGGAWRLLAIISCKVSFHARHTESAFWGLLVRISSNVPFVIVTEDRDIYKPKSSELGASCGKATATRKLLESFTDGIYLVNRYKGIDDAQLLSDLVLKGDRLIKRDNTVVFDDVTIPNHTEYCRSVRPIDDLIEDLRLWRKY